MGQLSHQEGLKDASVYSLWALHRLFLDLCSAVVVGFLLGLFLSASG